MASPADLARTGRSRPADLVVGAGLRPGCAVYDGFWAAWAQEEEADFLLLAWPEDDLRRLAALTGAVPLEAGALQTHGDLGAELCRRLAGRRQPTMARLREGALQGRTCTEIAHELGVCERTLREEVHAWTGRPVAAVVRCLRLRRARRRLALTQRPVEQVALEVGYAHAGALSRAFRRATGLAPRPYRTQVRGILSRIDGLEPHLRRK